MVRSSVPGHTVSLHHMAASFFVCPNTFTPQLFTFCICTYRDYFYTKMLWHAPYSTRWFWLCVFSCFGFPSWLTTPKRETLMRRQWKWPVFGWRYVSAALLHCATSQGVSPWMRSCSCEGVAQFKCASPPQEKDLVPKLFKVLAPRFETQPKGYTRIARIPNRQNLDRGKMAVLEYKGNPFPPLYPVRKENELTLINQLLKGYREERAQQSAAKA